MVLLLRVIHTYIGFTQVEACRARLFKMASLDLDASETPKTTAAWRESCSKAIIPEVSYQW